MSKINFLFSAFLFITLYPFGMCQNMERVIYAVTDTREKLYIDIYPASKKDISILFIYGGGFEGGDPEGQRPFAEEMQKRGDQVFMMSYRLLRKGGDLDAIYRQGKN